MSVAPAAPEILVIADLLVGLVFLLAFLVLLGILWTYRHTFGWLFEEVASFRVHIPLIGVNIHPLSIFGRIDRAFIAVISAGAAKTEKLSGRFFHAAAVVQGWIVRELKDLAVEVWSWANWLQRSHLPRWVKALIYAALPPLLLPRILKAIGHIDVPALYRKVRHIEQSLQHQVVRWIKRYAIYAIPGGFAIPGLIHGVRDLRKELAQWKIYKRRLSWLLSFASVGALVAAGIKALRLGWLRCSNVSKAGRAVCGLDTHFLETLLADALAIVGVISVVQFARDLRAVEDEAIGIMHKLVREFPAPPKV